VAYYLQRLGFQSYMSFVVGPLLVHGVGNRGRRQRRDALRSRAAGRQLSAHDAAGPTQHDAVAAKFQDRPSSLIPNWMPWLVTGAVREDGALEDVLDGESAQSPGLHEIPLVADSGRSGVEQLRDHLQALE
jgi:hypothetical protein